PMGGRPRGDHDPVRGLPGGSFLPSRGHRGPAGRRRRRAGDHPRRPAATATGRAGARRTGGRPRSGAAMTSAPRPRPRREAWSSLVPALILVPAAGGLLWYVGSLPHSLPETLLVILLGGAAVTLTLISVARVGEGVERAYWVSTPRADAVPPAALDYRLLRLRRDLRD